MKELKKKFFGFVAFLLIAVTVLPNLAFANNLNNIRVYVIIDGEELVRYVQSGSTVFDLAQELREEKELDFIVDLPWSKTISANMEVEIQTIEIRRIYETLAINYERIYIENDEMYLTDSVVVQEGLAGQRNKIIFSNVVAGEEVLRSIIRDEIVQEPVNKIIHVGTILPDNMAFSGDGKLFTFSNTLVMEATAYTLDPRCTGRQPSDPLFGITASGMRAQVGVVAVDTNVIPFHTRLYIEGYGFAVAGDRGGSIRGNRIDLFMDSRAEALQFGRRNLRVWILE